MKIRWKNIGLAQVVMGLVAFGWLIRQGASNGDLLIESLPIGSDVEQVRYYISLGILILTALLSVKILRSGRQPSDRVKPSVNSQAGAHEKGGDSNGVHH